MAVQNSFTSILVSWSASSDATWYTIDYNSNDGLNGSITVDNKTLSWNLTGVSIGESYIISVVAISHNLQTSTPISKQVTVMNSTDDSTVGQTLNCTINEYQTMNCTNDSKEVTVG